MKEMKGKKVLRRVFKYHWNDVGRKKKKPDRKKFLPDCTLACKPVFKLGLIYCCKCDRTLQPALTSQSPPAQGPWGPRQTALRACAVRAPAVGRGLQLSHPDVLGHVQHCSPLPLAHQIQLDQPHTNHGLLYCFPCVLLLTWGR